MFGSSLALSILLLALVGSLGAALWSFRGHLEMMSKAGAYHERNLSHRDYSMAEYPALAAAIAFGARAVFVGSELSDIELKSLGVSRDKWNSLNLEIAHSLARVPVVRIPISERAFVWGARLGGKTLAFATGHPDSRWSAGSPIFIVFSTCIAVAALLVSGILLLRLTGQSLRSGASFLVSLRIARRPCKRCCRSSANLRCAMPRDGFARLEFRSRWQRSRARSRTTEIPASSRTSQNARS